jgi:hypothetical protein
MTAVQRAARDRRIVEARDTGEPWATIIAREGVSERQARRAVERVRRLPAELKPVDIESIDATELLGRVVAEHFDALSELTRLGRQESPSAAAVGAQRARAAVGTQLVTLLATAGVVPQATDWRVLRDGQSFAKALLAVAADAGVDLDAVLARWEVDADANASARLPQLVVQLAEAA